MKKLVIFCAIALAFTACENGGTGGGQSNDITKTTASFHQLQIAWNGAMSPESVKKTVTLYDDKRLIVVVMSFEQFEYKDGCSGYADLTTDEYSQVLSLMDAANLDGFVIDPKCPPLTGGMGESITYLKSDMTYKEYATFCDWGPDIDALLDHISELATSKVPNCTEETFANIPAS